MAITLTSAEMFGLGPVQQDSFLKILNYLDTRAAEGAVSFPYIPMPMFFGFDVMEAKCMTSALEWAWFNHTPGVQLPASYMPFGFGDGEEQAILNGVYALSQSASFGEVVEPPAVVTGIFVDSVNGNDANSGATQLEAKQTLAGATAVAVSGDTIQLVRGSVYREQLTLLSDVNVGVVGTGAMPIIDAADTATGWTAAAGLANVWELTWVRPGPITGNDDLGLWVDGVRPRKADTNLDLRDGAPGGWFVDGGNYRLLSSVVRIQSATDPNTNGKLYEITRRNHAIGWHPAVVASTATVNVDGPIEAKRASNHYNAVAAGAGTVKNMLLRDGHIHHIVTAGSLTENVICTEIRPNLEIAGIPFTAYRANGTGFVHEFKGCMALFPGGADRIVDSTAFYAHSSEGTTMIDGFTLTNNVARGMDGVSCASQVQTVNNSYVEDPYTFGIDLNGFTTTVARTRVHNTTISPRVGGAVGIRNSNAAGNHTLTHSTVYNVSGTGMVDASGAGSTVVTNCAFVSRTAGGTLGGAAFSDGDGAHNYSIFDGNGRAVSGVGIGYSGDHNVFFSFAESGGTDPWFHWNAVAYFDFPAFRTASGTNTNSVYTKTADQTPGNANAFWLGVANNTGGPEVGDFRINPNAWVYDSTLAKRTGTFADGVALTLAGPQFHWDPVTEAVVAGPASVGYTLPATIADMRTHVENHAV